MTLGMRYPLVLAILAAVLVAASPASAAPPPQADVTAMKKVMTDSAAAWSRGDLTGFMEAYEHSPETAFVTPKGVLRGWEPMRERYRKTYGEGKALGALTFSDAEITALGHDYAVFYGRFNLMQPGAKTEQTGIFDLVMHRTAAGWRILSDHTS